MKTLAFIGMLVAALLLWRHAAQPLPLEDLPPDAYTAETPEEAEADMRKFMDRDFVLLIDQLKHRVFVKRAVWDRIGEDRRQQFKQFARQYFYLTSPPGTHAIVLDMETREVL